MTSVSTPTSRRSSATWRLPLFRSGHILVLNSAATAAAGFLFWLVAARLYPAAVVGSNAAAISAMMFLAGLAQLNLMSLLLRFVPTSGPRTTRLVAHAYLVGAGLSAIAGLVFVGGLRTWAPDLVDVLHGPTAAAFVVATAAWSIFVMQDNVLVGVQRPGIVAAENLFFSLAKIALLVPGTIWLATRGIWYAWALAAVLAAVATNAYLFGRAIPGFAARPVAASDTPSLRGMLGYLVPDYVGSLAWIAATALMPVLVLDLADPRRAAAFALAWQIAFTLFAVPAAFGQSLVAHGATNTDDADGDNRRVRAHVLRLVAPVSAGLVLVAPYLLRLFGRWYAEAGTSTLRLVAAAAVPNVVVALAVSHARVTRRMRTVVLTLGALCVLVLGLTVWLVPRVGVAGAGWAWVVGETVVAGVLLLPPGWRVRRIRSASGGLGSGAVQRTAVAVATDGWTVDGSRSTVSDTAVLFVHNSDRSAVVKISGSARGMLLLDRESRMLARLHADERLGAWRELLPRRLQSVAGTESARGLDTRLPGRVASGATLPAAAARAAIAPLHRLDLRPIPVSDELLRSWVLAPAEAVAAALSARRLACAPVDNLVDELTGALRGRTLLLGWTHGDFHPGNVLVDGSGRVTGLLDWSQARDTDLAQLDLGLWLLVASARRGRSLGSEVAGRLRGTQWTAEERDLLADGSGLPGRTVLLLAWLRHVTSNLAKSDRYGASTLWLHRTVLPVLRTVGR